jgi:hypothetical protein
LVNYEEKKMIKMLKCPILFFRRFIAKVRRSHGGAVQDKAAKECFGIKAG